MPPMSAHADIRAIDGGFPVSDFSVNGFSVNGFSVSGFPVNGFSVSGFPVTRFFHRFSGDFSSALNSIIYPIYYIAEKDVYAHVLDILQFSMKSE